MMKKLLFAAIAMLSMTAATAKDIKTVVLTPTPQMHCENCENRIKGNLRFLKGIKKIETSVPNQTVTIQYDADKTSVEKIQESMKKINYKTEVKTDNKKKVDGTTGATNKK